MQVCRLTETSRPITIGPIQRQQIRKAGAIEHERGHAGVDALTTAHLAEALQYRPRRVEA